MYVKSDYDSNMLFPGKIYCFKYKRKFIEHAVSTFKQYLIIIQRGGGRNKQSCKRESEAPFFYLFYISCYQKVYFYIKKSFLDINKSISWKPEIWCWILYAGGEGNIQSRQRVSDHITFLELKWYFVILQIPYKTSF